MEVQTSDGIRLGKVKEIWYGTDPTESSSRCDEEVCSRLEVRRGFLRRDVLYIPYNAITEVLAGRVTLNVDVATLNEKAWNQKPHWIPLGKQYDTPPYDAGGGMIAGG